MVRGVVDSLPFYVGRLLVEWLVFLGSCMVLVGVWALVLLVASAILLARRIATGGRYHPTKRCFARHFPYWL
ncbi:hypothetical protein [Sinomonas terrae]|uniref:Uncharacterized protein n=1 Tax=Sinomonas terrae TaxID=2908838 RepID=A0ABS9U6E5_9MICC|nr:hypothetical protein [Sinomonas terrae]MCH6472082.1 hypothetical protein [Sinomonas terrae]